MTLGLTNYTEPMSAGERAAIKSEKQQWSHMERQIYDLRELLRDVYDVVSSDTPVSAGLLARVKAQSSIGVAP